jgi:hypothetical protein
MEKLRLQFSLEDLPDYWMATIETNDDLRQLLVVLYETPLLPLLQDTTISYEGAYIYAELRKEFSLVGSQISIFHRADEKLPDFEISKEAAEFIIPLLKTARFQTDTSDIRLIFINKLMSALHGTT